jgi:hypothetical protein
MTAQKSKITRAKILRLAIVLILLCLPSVFLFSKLPSRSIVGPPRLFKPIASKIETPTQGAYLGVSTYQANFADVLATEQLLQKQFAIVGVYQSWGSENNGFNFSWASQMQQNHKIPFITWEPWVPVSGYDRSEKVVEQEDYKLKNISQNKFDSYIRSYARSVKDYGGPLMIRFAHEMNGNWYSWGSAFNTPQEYIEAYRHVHDLFIEEGATNVTWIWSPNAIYIEPKVPFADKIEEFYPGDEYVDWVGFSAFNWAGRYKNNVYQNPTQLYSQTHQALLKYNKPIMISETASAETKNPQTKAIWIGLLATYLKINPTIRGVIWFNIEDNGINWKIESSTSSINAFTKAFDSYFSHNFGN